MPTSCVVVDSPKQHFDAFKMNEIIFTKTRSKGCVGLNNVSSHVLPAVLVMHMTMLSWYRLGIVHRNQAHNQVI